MCDEQNRYVTISSFISDVRRLHKSLGVPNMLSFAVHSDPKNRTFTHTKWAINTRCTRYIGLLYIFSELNKYNMITIWHKYTALTFSKQNKHTNLIKYIFFQSDLYKKSLKIFRVHYLEHSHSELLHVTSLSALRSVLKISLGIFCTKTITHPDVHKYYSQCT